MRASILAALFPQWRDRDARLCREIVARGICAPTSDIGIAVRATLARVDSLREDRDDAERRWEDAVFAPPPQREKDRARIAELESARDATHADNQRLGSELCASRGLVAALRNRLDLAESALARRPMSHSMASEILGVCMDLLGVTTWAGVTAAIKALRDETATLRGIHRDTLRVVGERDEARRELAALRERVKDVAARMANEVQEVSNG